MGEVEPQSEAEVFDLAYGARSPLFGEVPTRMLEMLLKDGELCGSALELGCGDGRDTLMLLRRGFSVTAVDSSGVALTRLRERAVAAGLDTRRLNACQADVRHWQWEPEAFDLVVAVTLLDHLDADAGREVLSGMIVTLRPGGLLFVKSHTVDDPALHSSAGVSEFASQIRHYFDKNELLRWLTGEVRVCLYGERTEMDDDHGPPHAHGFATAIARKERPNVGRGGIV